MAQATVRIPLSQLIRDPFVRSAFERAERDGLSPVGVSPASPRVLTGGAACAPEPRYVAVSLLGDKPGSAVPVVKLKERVRDEIERLIAFLDASEPDPDMEEDDPPEDDPSGIADYEGLLEQCPSIYRHSERAE